MSRMRLGHRLILCGTAALGSAAALAHDIRPIVELKFTGGALDNTGSGAQTVAPVAPGEVVSSGGLDGSGCYRNHAAPVDGVNAQSQLGRLVGSGLDNDLRSLTVTMWLKGDVPFANAPNANMPLFDTAGFSFVSRDDAPPGSDPGEFGVSTGNGTQPNILFDRTVATTPEFGPGDVGQWRFVALTLDMRSLDGSTVTTVKLYRGSLTEPVALWGTGLRTQPGDHSTQINNAFAVGNHRNGDNYTSQRQFLGEIDDVRFYGSGSPGEAVLDPVELEALRSEAAAPRFRFIRGDCNGDGQVTGSTTDAVVLLSWSFLGGPQPPCLAACDIDGNGRAGGGVTDAVYLLLFNFLGGAAPPAPYPACGEGTASDEELGCATPPAACR